MTWLDIGLIIVDVIITIAVISGFIFFKIRTNKLHYSIGRRGVDIHCIKTETRDRLKRLEARL